MFYRNYWELLLVDDEPDVLAISRLALRGVNIYGVPLKIYTCGSKAEAIEFLKSSTTSPYIDLAIIDVVMESDTAGLDLCQFIRQDLCNDMTQLIVRTGQAGLAPERAVTDKYDINTYLTKVEATDAKLYACVKTAMRQSLYARTTEMLLGWARHLAEARSYAEFLRITKAALPALSRGAPSVEGHFAFFVGDTVIGVGRYESAEAARELRAELAELPSEPMSPSGDVFIRSGKKCLLQLADDPRHPTRVEIVAEINFEPAPAFWIRSFMEIMRCTRGMATHFTGTAAAPRHRVVPDPTKRSGGGYF